MGKNLAIKQEYRKSPRPDPPDADLIPLARIGAPAVGIRKHH